MRKILLILLISAEAGFATAQQLQLRQVVGGLSSPLGIVHAGDLRLFIVQQQGRIVIYDRTRILSAPFLDISSLVSCCGERGLLGLAFHPRYLENGRFFVYYTNSSGNITIARYNVSSDPNRADPASASIILNIPHPGASNHNGGMLLFGPDGYLYIGTGDGGGAGDTANNAQNLNVLLGKLLRIDVDSAQPYAIPPSNPFAGLTSAQREIWAFGLRNPWRFTFDRENGDFWIADVGQNAFEEIDYQPATSIGGENYGWRRMEGTHCFNPSTNCRDSSMTLPVVEYPHSSGACSVTGGYVYRGTEFPRFRGMYFYGDYCNGVMWGARRLTDGSVVATQLADTNLTISTFGEDSVGELYVADYGRGVIYQIADATPATRRRAAKSQ